MDHLEEIQIEGKPNLSFKVPRRILDHDEVVELVTKAVQLAQAKWEDETNVVVEETVKKAVAEAIAKTEEQAKSREKDIRRESYREGRYAALLICNPPIYDVNAKCSAVEGHPGIPQLIKDILSDPIGDDTNDTTNWVLPKFVDVRMYLTDLEGNLKRILGKYEGEDVCVAADGGVPTNMADEDGFYGKCTISSESGVIDGYCLGQLLLTGTAIILGADEQLYLFNPDAALDPEWS